MSEWKPVTEDPGKTGWYPTIVIGSLGWQQSFFDKATGTWSPRQVTYWTLLPGLPNVK